MLELRGIKRSYRTGELVQKALDDVSLTLRDSEFVCVLGPSGSGKTTLLNVIGGLDRYDKGDLLIGGVSTKSYRERDWDTYRNHTIGFVFQSYNLIPHLSVLANIELALTIAGVSASERRSRAREALAEVGLAGQEHKRPNQMSGGQMQRVAIARALVNDPEILLADEPTGALDSETSEQVMALLKKVAEKRLVVMVTHNAELAEQYATRIVRLRDGRITEDSDPCEDSPAAPDSAGKVKKAGMSFLTSLSLSAQNLRTKKGRTFLTALAGSIGIIGIALILAMSSSVNQYIVDIQRETMSSYPVTITAQTVDLSGLTDPRDELVNERRSAMADARENPDVISADYTLMEARQNMTGSLIENNLTAFKRWLDDPESEIHRYVGGSGIVYGYSVEFSVYAYDGTGALQDTNSDPDELAGSGGLGFDMRGMRAMSVFFGGSASSGASNFTELTPGADGQPVSQVILDSYELLAGSWPAAADEVVLVVGQSGRISVKTLYQLGLISLEEYQAAADAVADGTEPSLPSWTHAELVGRRFVLVPASERFVANGDGTFRELGTTPEEVALMAANGIPLHVSGVVRLTGNGSAVIMAPVGYTSLLTDLIIDRCNESAVVQAQLASPDTSVLTGIAFDPADDARKVDAAKRYIATLSVSDKATLYGMILYANPGASSFGSIGSSGMMPGGAAGFMPGGMDEEATDAMLTGMILEAADDDTLLMVYDQYVAGDSYESNLTRFGYVDRASPASISIYADSFEAKDAITASIRRYNETVTDSEKITYTDYIALITSSITTIVDVISYVLIAFVAVSLVVSCIMIGIITHISVLERTKEIGILRALGASRSNITSVFNAETVIVGFCAGLIGVLAAMALTVPINLILQALIGSTGLTVSLRPLHALILIAISMAITVVGGLIPARKASRKDPVEALRTE